MAVFNLRRIGEDVLVDGGLHVQCLDFFTETTNALPNHL